MTSTSELLRTLESDPGNPAFVTCAEALLAERNFAQALEVCVRGLSINPSLHRGRLLLAKVFYEMGCLGFAAREVEHLLKQIPESRTLRQLYAKLRPDVEVPAGVPASEEADETVAETDFDIEDFDLIAEED